MRIYFNSIFVSDQEKALEFYTTVLGFVSKTGIPLGKYKWLTVASPEDINGTELLLEPNTNSEAKTYQKAMFEQGIPLTSFSVENIQEEYKRLEQLGVAFSVKPTKAGTATVAVFNDTCGNFIQIVQI